MTQRIFDVENEKDMALLWDILPDNIESIEKKDNNDGILLTYVNGYIDEVDIFKINWHDKTEITRPIQEATEADVGKLCKFWDNACEDIIIGKLTVIETLQGKMCYRLGDFACFDHCRRLTKQEIEELC